MVPRPGKILFKTLKNVGFKVF